MWLESVEDESGKCTTRETFLAEFPERVCLHWRAVRGRTSTKDEGA
jgi:hypothetical protein